LKARYGALAAAERQTVSRLKSYLFISLPCFIT
jgi:hypothetical protein